MNTDVSCISETGENYTDDGSEASEATYRPKVVHLGQFASNGSQIPRSFSPITVSLDRHGHHRRIQLEHSEDGSFGGSQGSDRSFSPHMPHARSAGSPSGHPQPNAGFGLVGNHRSHFNHVRLRTIYP
ncbi:hypothetical protein B0F90DRAFT_254601 [Multifurca ochricompacta]|uniref:Uncharacterized protein n=1 Tax=Multifurca ochricompacta TaxID=376703 RepID=A0AAD4QMR9_9AGAM|nr:hypothetical protein B0F90DRAFT_254601 [Multifurca ochricompacta]